MISTAIGTVLGFSVTVEGGDGIFPHTTSPGDPSTRVWFRPKIEPCLVPKFR
jgi:hypothetical protein